MVQFTVQPHKERRNASVVEVRNEKGTLLMTIYPDDSGVGIRVVSKYQLSFVDRSEGMFCIYEMSPN